MISPYKIYIFVISVALAFCPNAVLGLKTIRYQGITPTTSMDAMTCALSVTSHDAHVGARLNNVTNVCEPLLQPWFESLSFDAGYSYFVKTISSETFDNPVTVVWERATFNIPVYFSINSTIEFTFRTEPGWQKIAILLADSGLLYTYFVDEQYLLILKAYNYDNKTEYNQFASQSWVHGLYNYVDGMPFLEDTLQTVTLRAGQDNVEIFVDSVRHHKMALLDNLERTKHLLVECSGYMEITGLHFYGSDVPDGGNI